MLHQLGTWITLYGLQENKSGSTLVPAKRSCDASAAYEIEVNETEAITENNSDPCAKVAKKFKLSVVSPIQNTVPDLMLSQKDGFPAQSCGGSQPVQKGNLEDDARIGVFEAIGFLKDGGAECGASRSVLCGSDPEHNVLLPKRMSARKKFQNIVSSSNGNAELGTSSGSSQLVTQQDSHTHGSEYDLGCNLQQDLQKICKENIAHSDEFEFSSDIDEYHDESTDLSAQKINFLNSQYAQHEDSFANADCNELNLCVKCNEGGKLLVCSSDTCPLTVHESCLGSIPNFDHKENFYCPFCAYSRAICEYLEGKKMVSLARTDFAAFIDFGAGQQSKKSLPRSQGTKENQSQQDKNEELSHNENGKKLNTVSAEA